MFASGPASPRMVASARNVAENRRWLPAAQVVSPP